MRETYNLATRRTVWAGILWAIGSSVQSAQPVATPAPPSPAKRAANESDETQVAEVVRHYWNQFNSTTDAVGTLARQLGATDEKVIVSEQQLKLDQLNEKAGELGGIRNALDGAIEKLHAQSQSRSEIPASERLIEDRLERDPRYVDVNVSLRDLKAKASALRTSSPQRTILEREIARYEQNRMKLRSALMRRILSGDVKEWTKQHQTAELIEQVKEMAEQIEIAGREYQALLASYLEYVANSAELGTLTAQLSILEREFRAARAAAQSIQNRRASTAANPESQRDVKTILRDVRALLEELEEITSE